MEILPFNEYRAIINSEIQKELIRYEATLSTSDEAYTTLIRDMRENFSNGGKRLRAYLAYLAYCGTGGTDMETILKIGVSLELLHSFLLIHDDIIDQDTVRYGADNITGIYQKRFSALLINDARRNANNVSILAGDIAHLLSSNIITELNVEDSIKLKLLKSMFQRTIKVAEGELVDFMIVLSIDREPVSEQRILDMYEKKTAAYTIELPLCVGMIAACGSIHEQKNIDEFSHFLGVAFQLQDDILGVFGNKEQTGKSDDGDIREGKKTLLYMKTISQLKDEQLKRFLMIYGNPHATQEEIQEIKMLMETNDIRKNVEQLYRDYVLKSEELVSSLGMNHSSQTALLTLISLLKSRTS